MLFTRPARPSAHFSPMSPAPTIITVLSGFTAASRASMSSIVMKVNFSSTVSSPSMGGTNGDEPVAAHSFP